MISLRAGGFCLIGAGVLVGAAYAAALALGLAGMVPAATTGASPRPFSLASLGLVSVALVATGWGMGRGAAFDTPPPEC